MRKERTAHALHHENSKISNLDPKEGRSAGGERGA